MSDGAKAYMKKRGKRGREEFARSGALALNAARTPEERRTAALAAVNARWARRKTT